MGQTAPKTTVEFPNNPFPQTLEVKPWIDYFVLPLQAGFGAVGKRQSLFVHAGVYLALEEGSRLPWVVNGSPYYGAPVPSTQDSDNGWSLELEYAFRLRHGSLLLSAGSRKSFSSIVTGMDGSTRLGTGTVSLGYGFDL